MLRDRTTEKKSSTRNKHSPHSVFNCLIGPPKEDKLETLRAQAAGVLLGAARDGSLEKALQDQSKDEKGEACDFVPLPNCILYTVHSTSVC